MSRPYPQPTARRHCNRCNMSRHTLRGGGVHVRGTGQRTWSDPRLSGADLSWHAVRAPARKPDASGIFSTAARPGAQRWRKASQQGVALARARPRRRNWARALDGGSLRPADGRQRKSPCLRASVPTAVHVPTVPPPGFGRWQLPCMNTHSRGLALWAVPGERETPGENLERPAPSALLRAEREITLAA